MKLRTIFILAAGVLLAVSAVWWGLMPAEVPGQARPVVSSEPARAETANPPVSANLPPASVAASGKTAGELLADESLNDRQLISGLTGITLGENRTPQERDEAMSHLLNLAAGDESEAGLLALATDKALSPALARRLFEDSLNRRLGWQVDLALAVLARRDMAALHGSLRDHLLFLVGPDVAADSDLNALKQAGAAAKKRWAEQAAE